MKKLNYLLLIVTMLLTTAMHGQFTDSTIYNFVDGSIISAGESPDGSLKLIGTFNLHSAPYGIRTGVGNEIKVAVGGNSSLRFLGSAFSNLDIQGSSKLGIDLGEQSTTVTADLAETYDFVYYGPADTLSFITKGSGTLYLPQIELVPAQKGGNTKLDTATRNIIYYYDLRDGSLVPDTSASASYTHTIDSGLFKLECGPSNAYAYNGSTHGSILKTGNKITLKVAGNSIIKIAGCQYSNPTSTVAVSSTSGDFDISSQYTKTAACYHVDGSTVDFTYVGTKGEVVLEFDGGTTYVPLIEVVPIPYDVELNPWVEKSGSIIINNDTIYLTAGASSADNAIVTLDKGTVESAGPETAIVRLNLDGNDLDSFTPKITGDISSVNLVNDTIYVAWSDSSSIPFGYAIKVLNPWVEKSGTISLNGVNIDVTAGATADENINIVLSDGTIMSATSTFGAIRIDLAGNSLDTYTPAISGDISSVSISNDTIYLAWADSTADPYGYILTVSDNSIIVEAEPGKTYTYDFTDGSVITEDKTIKYTSFVSEDGILTINSNTEDESVQFAYWNDHGAAAHSGNSFDLLVSGNATITLATCYYAPADAILIFSDSEGNILDTITASNASSSTEGVGASKYTYEGTAGTLTATFYYPNSSSNIYVHGLTIANAAIIEPSDGKIEVWDFGAEQLDTSIYKNNLTEDIINAWYPESVVVGSPDNTLPSFTAGVLSWVGGGNDRLRTTNTNLTRYDAQAGSSVYTGRIYVNAGAAVGRYLSLTLSEDDEVTLIALSQNGSGKLNFEYFADPETQTDVADLSTEAAEFNFVAKQAGTYHIYDDLDKPSYFRIYRKDATYVTLTGDIDLSAADGIPSEYAIQFTNEAGKTWTATMNTGDYNMRIPIGYDYKLSLADANGYIISSGNTLTVTDTTTVFDIAIEKVELYTVSGSITGLGQEISKLILEYIADAAEEKIYVPEPIINSEAGTYSVQLEPNCEYTISGKGVNDFYIPANTITIGKADVDADIIFAAKPVYDVTINATGLEVDQLADLNLIFTNLNEAGYVYGFDDIEAITLRDGTYTIDYDSLDAYPVEMGLTSNLTVSGAAVSKDLVFSIVTNWPFNDKDIENGDPAYKGLLFDGTVYNQKAKSHLVLGAEGIVKVPANEGDKIRITYYYSADFSIDGGDAITTNSQSTSLLEYVEYSYPGTEAGFVTITNGAATTYITNIEIGGAVEYAPILYVGEDKDYKTINGALSAVAKMVRENEERVTIMVDPGNYEEMIVVDVPNVTLKNASSTPDIKLANAGVDISDNAVRITSYYGHGYNYYSMDSDQKWNAERLRVNKENGYLSYENVGSGTTNGSYWNATAVIAASGFVAEDIIFENSFNQYISQKEADDIVVMWESGSKGERPTTYGSTAVQNKSFVERAAAISITSADKIILNRCRVIGRQDSFYGADGARVVVYKGSMMGGTDYLFGGMIAVFYKSDLAMNTSEDNNDISYITAAYQSGGRGYLMYECDITSAQPGTETASEYISKPGYFGRPWKSTTSEVVFYNTTIETTNNPSYDGQSLIKPEGWNSSLGGESEFMYEYGTIEKSGIDNEINRAIWATFLTAPTLNDGTEITTFNFTKGDDDWDPLPELIANDTVPDEEPDFVQPISVLNIKTSVYDHDVFVSNVTSETHIDVYSLKGTIVYSEKTFGDTQFTLEEGLWIISIRTPEGQKAIKTLIH